MTLHQTNEAEAEIGAGREEEGMIDTESPEAIAEAGAGAEVGIETVETRKGQEMEHQTGIIDMGASRS